MSEQTVTADASAVQTTTAPVNGNGAKPKYTTSKKHNFAETEYEFKFDIADHSDEFDEVPPMMVSHLVSKPKFEDEEARERMMPFSTETSGKKRGKEGWKTDFDDEKANCRFYDRVVKRISGYPIDGSVRRFKDHPTDPDADSIKNEDFEDLAPDTILNDVDPQELFFFEGKAVPYVSLIPAYHKTAIVNKMLDHVYVIKAPKFSLGAGRRWTVTQEIGGGGVDENGVPRDPAKVVNYVLREPTEGERRKYRSKAIGTNTNADRGVVREVRVSNLRIFAELFDAMIDTCDGEYGKGVPINVRDAQQLGSIEGTFKKYVIGQLFRSLEVDLGN